MTRLRLLQAPLHGLLNLTTNTVLQLCLGIPELILVPRLPMALFFFFPEGVLILLGF